MLALGKHVGPKISNIKGTRSPAVTYVFIAASSDPRQPGIWVLLAAFSHQGVPRHDEWIRSGHFEPLQTAKVCMCCSALLRRRHATRDALHVYQACNQEVPGYTIASYRVPIGYYTALGSTLSVASMPGRNCWGVLFTMYAMILLLPLGHSNVH